MGKIKFSIAVATFNSAATIEELLSSIYNQNYEDYEVIFIDGKSKDNTLNIIKKYLRSQDILVSEPDNGVYDAMNKALGLATGDFLIFMGSDDHFLSWSVLSNIAKVINTTGMDNTVYYGNVLMEAYHSIWNKNHSLWDWTRGTICHQALFYPKSIYKKYQYDTKYRINADYDYNLRIYKDVHYRHVNVLISYFSSAGLSGNNHVDVEWQKDWPKKIKTNLGFMPYIYRIIRRTARLILKGSKF